MELWPARIAYVVKGSDTKIATKISHGNAVLAWPSGSTRSTGPTRPRSWPMMLNSPEAGLSIHLNTIPVMRTDAAHGAISAHRATRRPGNRLLNSWASPSETTVVMATTDTTQTTVRSTTPANAGSPNRWWKLSKPALPSTSPKALTRRNAVWNMLTTGQAIAKPISASAGPIQSNGVSVRAARLPAL